MSTIPSTVTNESITVKAFFCLFFVCLFFNLSSASFLGVGGGAGGGGGGGVMGVGW